LGYKMKSVALCLSVFMQSRAQRTPSRAIAKKGNVSEGGKTGCKNRIGEAGRSEFRPGVQHIVPTAAAGRTGLPAAPGPPDSVDPRFRHLPPPRESYSSRHGAFQPKLLSRIDGTEDIRVSPGMGADLPPTADTTCLVPEPYCQAIRPDQRIRAAAAIADDEEMTRSLEKENRWHRQQKGSFHHHDEFRYATDEVLRKKLLDATNPVSGNRQTLMARLRWQEPVAEWSKSELADAATALGLPASGLARSEVLQVLSARWDQQKFSMLSEEELRRECEIRKLSVHGTKAKLLRRIDMQWRGVGSSTLEDAPRRGPIQAARAERPRAHLGSGGFGDPSTRRP